MSIFVCHVHLAGDPFDELPIPLGLRPAAAENEELVTIHDPALVAWGYVRDRHERPSIARIGSCVAFGDARLQNRQEVASRVCSTESTNDLGLIVEALQRHGYTGLRTCFGAFAFVLWDPKRQQAVLVRDALGLQPLYYARHGNQIVVSSRASALAVGDDYDEEFIGDLLVNGANLDSRTVYRGVHAVPPGSLITFRERAETPSAYWSPHEFGPEGNPSLDDAADHLRSLLSDALLADHTGTTETWAALSGGIDSSAIVCLCEWLTRAGRLPSSLGGTASIYDTIGKADERMYSNAVVALYGVPNEQLEGGWPWQGFDDDMIPPSDQPCGAFIVRHTFVNLAALVRQHGGRVYLSGLGPDHYLSENLNYIGDLAVRGRLWKAGHELLRWSVAKRRSVWRTAFRQVLYPMLPRPLALRYTPTPSAMPPWLRQDFVRRCGVDARLQSVRRVAGPLGRQYRDSIAYDIRHLSQQLHPDLFENGITTRYPYLYQPLLEFALTLPPHLRCQPAMPKRALTHAMRGVLPELIRGRTGKGATGTRATWALEYQRDLLAQLTRDPILAQLGLVDQAALRRRAAFASRGRGQRMLPLLSTLTIETWLQVRAGRWRGSASHSFDIGDRTNVRVPA
jgi:asparagine synthase (glutamine-hydrolysing)